MDARLIVDAPATGTWNMAVDEALFQSAQQTHLTTLRLYQWSRPTVSLGYFQPASLRHSYSPIRDCPWVRRTTGGGAIVHDRELTYSLVTPIAGDRSPDSLALVDRVHAALIDLLKTWGFEARQFGQRVRPSAMEEPFLCFDRRTEHDVVVGDHKIAGSAQRRLRGTLLQHGSVLLARSRAAPNLKGVWELRDQSIPQELFSRELFYPENFCEDWIGPLATSLGWQLADGTYTVAELTMARDLEKSKFSAAEWNEKR